MTDIDFICRMIAFACGVTAIVLDIISLKRLKKWERD